MKPMKITPGMSASTKDLLITMSQEEKAAIDELTKQFVYSRHLLWIMFLAFFAFSTVIVGLLSAVIYSYNIQRNVSSNNNLLNTDKSDVVGTASVKQATMISSESPMSTLEDVVHLHLTIPSAKGNGDISLKPTGFSRFECTTGCLAKHVVYFYTSEAIVIYHGNMTFLTNPSNAMVQALQYHGAPVYANMTRTLLQSDGPERIPTQEEIAATLAMYQDLDGFQLTKGSTEHHRKLQALFQDLYGTQMTEMPTEHHRKLWLQYVWMLMRGFMWIIRQRWVQKLDV